MTTPSPDLYEKLGVFYLGSPVSADAEADAPLRPLLYDAKDLTTHAVILGMTGSGKTGLGVTLLEEAAMDGVPALIIDPKGDMGNLLLTFPELRPEDFRPWVDPARAAREGLDADQLAAREAATWAKGLDSWGQDAARIGRLRQAVDMAIYTPGSSAGRPISILSSFAAPGPETLDDGDLLRERVATTVSGLLGLLGIDADPVQSREHILLSTILDHAWQDGRGLDLAGLIQQVQTPPVQQVGVMSLDTFFPSKDRFGLAMRLNALLAAPSFQSWLEGEPLDVDQLLYTADGRPRLAVLSIAHLSDEERMFFVSLLLAQTLGWMRRKSGTSSLRALVYMDEVFGYLPPVGEPPSKKPLLTLLKQARAYGLGLVLATQNPVDLDYKALSNIGTWFLGRLQTERDQQRVMDGLMASGAGLDRGALELLLAGLDKRVFLLHNVHEDGPELFRVRWAMSYLCGPLTRQQIKRLTPDPAGRAAARAGAAVDLPPVPRAPASRPNSGATASRPVLQGVEERFLPLEAAETAVYRPGLLGHARVHFIDRKHDLEADEELLYWADVDGDGVDWAEAEILALDDDDLADAPADGASFAPLPSALGDAKKHKEWEKDLADFLYRERRWHLFESERFELVSRPGESERDFRIRVTEAAREQRDLEVEKLRQSFDKKRNTLEGRLHRAEQKVSREQQQAKEQKLQTMVRMGTTLLGAFLGRKTLSRTNLNKAGTALRGVSRSMKERQDVELAEEDVARFEQELAELDRGLQDAVAELESRFDATAEVLGDYEMKPRRTDVDVRWVAVGWAP